MDAASVLNSYRDRIATGQTLGLRDQILRDLERKQIAVPTSLRTLIDRSDFFTLAGFDAAVRSLQNPSSSIATTGRATTSYLGLLTQQIGAAEGRPARNAATAQIEVDSVLKGLMESIHAATNEELLKTLADRAARSARQLSCDLVNECGSYRGSLDKIEANYTAAFARSLQRIGIDFDGGYWARAKLGKAGGDRLDVEIRLNSDLTAAFEAEQKKPIASATRDEVVQWFMKRKPDIAELEALALQGGPSNFAETVREGFFRALVSDATPRYPQGSGIWNHVGHFAMQWIPRDVRGEPDVLASRIMEAAYRRIGLVPLFERRVPYEPGKPGSIERGKLALSIRNDEELSAAFERDTKKPIANATSDDIFAWFEKSTPRLDQVLRIATQDLPSDDAGVARERLIDLVIGQAESQKWNSTALIVIRNSLEDQRRNDVLINLGPDLLERIQAHPVLAKRIAEEKPKDVLEWFGKQRPDAGILVALAGI
jgi:hypothetical protein